MPVSEAVIYTGLGPTGRALDRLEEARRLPPWFKVDPVWAPLRGEPRYQRMLEEMGLDDQSVQRTMKRRKRVPPVVSIAYVLRWDTWAS